MGATATQMERRGVATELGDINREIKVKNNLLQQLVDKIIQLKDWLKQAFVPKEPTLIKKIQSYIENVKNKNPWQIIWFDNEENAIKYLQENNIFTLPELREKIYEGQKFSNTAYEFRELASILKTVESIVPDDQQKTDPPKKKLRKSLFQSANDLHK